MFFDAKGDCGAVAFSAASLIYQQRASTHSKAALNSAGQIPFRTAPVAMEHQFDGSTGSVFVEFTVKSQTVKGSDGNFFMGKRPDFLHPGGHNTLEGFVDLARRDGVLFFADRPLFGDMECNIITDVRAQQRQKANCRGGCQQV